MKSGDLCRYHLRQRVGFPIYPRNTRTTRIMNQPTTQHTEAPEQPLLPGMEEVRTASDSDRVPRLEELAAENEQLKAEIRMRSAVYDIETRLTQAGARSPGLLVERAKESFQFSESGELANAEAVVEHLRRTWPEQFAPASIDASAGRSARPTLTKEALQQMTSEEIKRLDWAEVRSALQSN